MRGRNPGFYSLKKQKIRQSWNKHNLFNLASWTPRPLRFKRTFFQQKWYAKSVTRGYHAPQMRERDWARMFNRRIPAAIDIDPKYLAKHDGTEQSAGRGCGRQVLPGSEKDQVNAADFSSYDRRRRRMLAVTSSGTFTPHRYEKDVMIGIQAKPMENLTPYMQMTYAPLERRLDTAIFRAMFASSTLQARQFCIHGSVTVNGKKIRYPAYQLNPGDMFQVDPERVLFAVGKPKNPQETARIAKRLAEQEERAAAREAEEQALRDAKLQSLDAKLRSADEQGGGLGPQAEASEQAASDTAVEAETAAAIEAAAADAHLGEDGEPITEDERRAAHKSELKRLVLRAKSILQEKDNMRAPQKQRVRLFLAEAKRAISRAGNKAATDAEPADAESAELSREAIMDHLAVILKGASLEEGTASTSMDADADAASSETPSDDSSLTARERDILAELIKEDAENPYDESKPYLTPWTPRDYIRPFAFIPRYLEVNQNICAAVYLRHPVARRGQAEVPTPFTNDLNQLAFNWYLRRR